MHLQRRNKRNLMTYFLSVYVSSATCDNDLYLTLIYHHVCAPIFIMPADAFVAMNSELQHQSTLSSTRTTCGVLRTW